MAFDISWSYFLKEWFPAYSRYLNGKSYEEFIGDVKSRESEAWKIFDEALFMALREIVQNRIDAEVKKEKGVLEELMREDPYEAIEKFDEVVSRVLSAFEIDISSGKLVYNFDKFNERWLTLGKSEDKSEDSVGMFGRGLKEALAVFAVFGGDPEIIANGKRYRFVLADKDGEKIIDKKVEVVGDSGEKKLVIDLEKMGRLYGEEKDADTLIYRFEQYLREFKVEKGDLVLRGEIKGKPYVINVRKGGRSRVWGVPIFDNSNLYFSYDFLGSIVKKIDVDINRRRINWAIFLFEEILETLDDNSLGKYVRYLAKNGIIEFEPLDREGKGEWDEVLNLLNRLAREVGVEEKEIRKYSNSRVYKINFRELGKGKEDIIKVYRMLVEGDKRLWGAFAKLIKEELGDEVIIAREEQAYNLERVKYLSGDKKVLVLDSTLGGYKALQALDSAFREAGIKAELFERAGSKDYRVKSLGELSEEEMRIAAVATYVAGAVLENVFSRKANLELLGFAEIYDKGSERTFGAYSNGTVLIDPSKLEDFKDIIKTVVHEMSHASGGDGTIEHAHAMQDVFSELLTNGIYPESVSRVIHITRSLAYLYIRNSREKVKIYENGEDKPSFIYDPEGENIFSEIMENAIYSLFVQGAEVTMMDRSLLRAFFEIALARPNIRKSRKKDKNSKKGGNLSTILKENAIYSLSERGIELTTVDEYMLRIFSEIVKENPDKRFLTKEEVWKFYDRVNWFMRKEGNIGYYRLEKGLKKLYMGANF